MTRITARIRFPALAALLAIALAAGTASAAGATTNTAGVASASRPASPECANPRHANTSIVGTIQNETNLAISLVRAEHGITNKWCIRPADHIPAHGSSRYDATDRIFDTAVTIVYSFPSSLGTSVRFYAARQTLSLPFLVGCEVRGTERSRYRCEGILTKIVSRRHATVIFKVLPPSHDR